MGVAFAPIRIVKQKRGHLGKGGKLSHNPKPAIAIASIMAACRDRPRVGLHQPPPAAQRRAPATVRRRPVVSVVVRGSNRPPPTISFTHF
jgi:hypothetical protein